MLTVLKRFGWGVLVAGVLMSGCTGDTGPAGTNGTNGTNGTDGTDGTDGTNGNNGANGIPGNFRLVIDGVVTEADLSKSTLTFTVFPAANVCPGGVCNDSLANGVAVGTKTFYATEFNSASKTFDTARSFSFSGVKFKGFTSDGNGAQYTATKATPSFAPEKSASAYVYAYVTGLAAAPAPESGHYLLPSSVASASKMYGTMAWESNAVVSGCEKCHGAPYAKHGYRMATVEGLPTFVACKACHTDQRPGSDANWYMIADDPANYEASLRPDGTLPPDLAAKYAYTANVMNDTHNSHAFEFNYPQSMSNCSTCHEGKLSNILTDANFRPTVCKSCHPVTGPDLAAAGGGVERGRAPSLKAIFNEKNVGMFHSMDLYAATAGGVDVNPAQCNTCHKSGGVAKTFAEIHSGMNSQIYSAEGVKWSDSIKAAIGTTSYDPASRVLTVNFTVTGAAANALVKPTVVASLYGWNTKDFVVSGHGSAADSKRNLEFTEGATNNSDRLTLNPAVATAGNGTWTATANLSTWAAKIDSGEVKRIEVAILPAIGLDQTQAVSATNPMIAVAGTSETISLADGGIDAEPYGKDIVDSKKCNACHDALATTFHNPNYGSAGVAACRSCHWVGSGGSHLEMQSRSIDSYVHAIHRMQYMDIQNVDFTDPVQALRYGDHVEGNYPNFAGPLNCESCHEAGKYNPPDQTRSLPSIISASRALKAGSTRNIGTVPAQITGPAERACGGCHRAAFINEDDSSSLAAFYVHTSVNGSSVSDTSAASLDAVNQYIMGMVGATAPAQTVPAGAAVETCVVCHKRAGDEHQALFNSWKNGLEK